MQCEGVLVDLHKISLFLRERCRLLGEDIVAWIRDILDPLHEPLAQADRYIHRAHWL